MIPPALARIAIGALAVWTVLCLAVIGWQTAANPMRAREEALNGRLATPSYFNDVPEPDNAPPQQYRSRIMAKTALWKELVAAAPAAPKPTADPNLQEKLKGISATRQQISTKDGISVKIFMGPQDKRGSWKKVGDTINGLTVREIKAEAVVFAIKQGEKEYTVELPRR